MDCCDTSKKGHNKSKMKGGKIKVEKRIILWIIIGILFIAVLFLTFQAGSIQNVVAEPVKQSVASSSSAMVGGC